MGKKFTEISPRLISFIQEQKIFFVGTAAEEGRVNVSPKGMDSLRVINSNKIVWLNLTGSGNETAAHLLRDKRMTIMFCSFETNPMILRLYGSAQIYHSRDEQFHQHIKLFPEFLGTRQIIEMDVDLVQTSCGFAVPFMEFQGERPTLTKWAENKGPEGISQYWEQKNQKSLDNFETKILSE